VQVTAPRAAVIKSGYWPLYDRRWSVEPEVAILSGRHKLLHNVQHHSELTKQQHAVTLPQDTSQSHTQTHRMIQQESHDTIYSNIKFTLSSSTTLWWKPSWMFQATYDKFIPLP